MFLSPNPSKTEAIYFPPRVEYLAADTYKNTPRRGRFRFARRRVSARGEYRVPRRQPRAGTPRGHERDLRKPEPTEAEVCSGGLARMGQIRIVLMARMEASHYVGSANRFRSQERRFHVRNASSMMFQFAIFSIPANQNALYQFRNSVPVEQFGSTNRFRFYYIGSGLRILPF